MPIVTIFSRTQRKPGDKIRLVSGKTRTEVEGIIIKELNDLDFFQTEVPVGREGKTRMVDAGKDYYVVAVNPKEK